MLYSLQLDQDDGPKRLALLLETLRERQGLSKRHVADGAGLSVSMVHRAEKGQDCRLTTWAKLFAGVGYVLLIDHLEIDETVPDMIAEERDERLEKRRWKY